MEYKIYKNDGIDTPQSKAYKQGLGKGEWIAVPEKRIYVCETCDNKQPDKVVWIGDQEPPDYDIYNTIMCLECIKKIANDERWS